MPRKVESEWDQLRTKPTVKELAALPAHKGFENIPVRDFEKDDVGIFAYLSFLHLLEVILKTVEARRPLNIMEHTNLFGGINEELLEAKFVELPKSPNQAQAEEILAVLLIKLDEAKKGYSLHKSPQDLGVGGKAFEYLKRIALSRKSKNFWPRVNTVMALERNPELIHETDVIIEVMVNKRTVNAKITAWGANRTRKLSED